MMSKDKPTTIYDIVNEDLEQADRENEQQEEKDDE